MTFEFSVAKSSYRTITAFLCDRNYNFFLYFRDLRRRCVRQSVELLSKHSAAVYISHGVIKKQNYLFILLRLRRIMFTKQISSANTLDPCRLPYFQKLTYVDFFVECD